AQGIIEKRPEDGYEEFYYSHHPYPDGPEPEDYARWLQEEKGVNINRLYPDTQKAYGPGVPEEFHQTTWAGARALEFIENNKDKSWMLNINLFDPHPPFDPPEEFLHHYQEKDIPLPFFQESDISSQKQFEKLDQQVKTAKNILEMDQKNMELRQNTEGPTHSSAPSSYNPRKIKACYYASIELIDKYTGIIMDKLEQLDLLQDTIIIFMSDHGELLGDHGLLYKGCRFYEGLVHVPLIISGQGRFKENVKSKALVELIDIAPTLLDAAGIETPYWIQGKSLYPLLTGKKTPDHHKSQVIAEYNDALNLPEASHGFMCFDGKYKIAVYQDLKIGEIYDLENDPEEFNNLWTDPEYEELKQKLLKKLINSMMKSESAGIKRTGDY
ncbi:MAG: sulfatase, partial [Bacillota bacterium]